MGVFAVPDWKVFVFGGNSGNLAEGGNPQVPYCTTGNRPKRKLRFAVVFPTTFDERSGRHQNNCFIYPTHYFAEAFFDILLQRFTRIV